MIDIIEYLITNKIIRLLHGFSNEECREFLSLGIIKEYNQNDVIVSENQEDINIYLIVEGEASLWRKNVPILEFQKGDVFNETKIYSPRSNSYTIIAEQQTVVLKFSRNDILLYFSFKPERLFKIFTLNVISILLKNIEDNEDQIISFYYQSMQLMKDLKS